MLMMSEYSMRTSLLPANPLDLISCKICAFSTAALFIHVCSFKAQTPAFTVAFVLGCCLQFFELGNISLMSHSSLELG